ncbi:hypothetical protein BH11BAC1_BH11BAC1_29250 [soil metagenome]
MLCFGVNRDGFLVGYKVPSSEGTLLVRHTCSFTIGCKSRADVDHRELLAESKGVAARQGLKEAEGKYE